MPKKKGKKGGKGKGKGKGGKGKKGKAPKVDRDVELTMAVANAKLWSARLDVTEKSRVEYREACKRMAVDNEKMHDALFQNEKDTIDVISFLKKGDLQKDEEIANLQQEIRDVKKDNRTEKDNMLKEFNGKMSEVENKLHQRTSEVKLMQSELKMVKEFRRKRAQMQSELDEIRENLYMANREHKDTMQKMEYKFFEEKIRLEREASEKIAELAERAHTEAIANLDETTRSVYKENVRLNEALSYHIKETNNLQTERDALLKEVEELRAQKELNTATVREKVIEGKQQKTQIQQLKNKIDNLENALSMMVNEFQKEKKIMSENSKQEMMSLQLDVTKLERTLEIKENEMNKVKYVAKNILKQRSNMETFFLDALEQVRREIAMNRAQYIEVAKSAYNKKMRAAHSGTGEYPKIRTFLKNDVSTNSVYADLSEAENWSALGSKVDIRELTWEQKEKVLRLLFAKMNGIANVKKKRSQLAISHQPSSAPALQQTQQIIAPGGEKTQTFVTQSEEGELSKTSLPKIHPQKVTS